MRDLNWLDQLGCVRLDDPARGALIGKLARLAAAEFCQPLPPGRYYREDPTCPELTLPVLIRTLVISGDDPTLEQLIRFVTLHPRRFAVDKVRVHGLNQVVIWHRKQNSSVHRLVIAWLRTLQQEQSAATADQPQPPADWARPAEIACTFQFCKQLNAILADPYAATWQTLAREEVRSHLIFEIYEHQCDVTHKLERTGSPRASVFAKTNGSFERRLQRYVADQKLLETVNGLLLP